MQRYRGHFYNWYDTETLGPLAPALHLHRRQRQPRRLPGHAAQRPARPRRARRSSTRRCLLACVMPSSCVEEEIARGFRQSGTRRRGARSGASLPPFASSCPRRRKCWRNGTPSWRSSHGLSAMGVLLHELDESSASTSSEVAPVRLPKPSTGTNAPPPPSSRVRRSSTSSPGGPASSATPRSRLHRTPRPWPVSLNGARRRCASSATIVITLNARRDRARLRRRRRSDGARRTAGGPGRRPGRGNRVRIPLQPRTAALFDWLQCRGREDSIPRTTTHSPPKRGSPASSRIATGRIPHEHWFKLGRSLTPTGTSRALLSWSASMFEYLMPLLVMRAYPSTLLDETYEAVVSRQMKYGAQRGVPWGISESAYNAAGPRRQLSVPRIRRTRTGTQTWPRRRSRRSHPMPPCSRRWSRQATPSPTSKALREAGLAGRLRLLRSDRLHPASGCRKTIAAGSCSRPTWRTTRA